MADPGKKCTCSTCDPINNEVICQTFAQTAMRYNDGSAHAALMGLNTQQNLQAMFNVQAQQGLESSNESRLAEAILMLSKVGAPPVA